MKAADALMQKIVDRIDFRLLKEYQPGGSYDSADLTRADGYRSLDVANTHIRDQDCLLFDIDFLRTPRLSTVANAYIINQLVRSMPNDQTYLNIGTWCGFSLFSGILGNPGKSCVGVDNFVGVGSSESQRIKEIFSFQYSHFKSAQSAFFEMDYQDYFTGSSVGPIGVYFYDAAHTYEHQMKGLVLADPYIAENGYVIVDDTNMIEARDATLDFANRMGGTYSIVFDIRTSNNGHPTFWNGLMVLKKQRA